MVIRDVDCNIDADADDDDDDDDKDDENNNCDDDDDDDDEYDDHDDDDVDNNKYDDENDRECIKSLKIMYRGCDFTNSCIYKKNIIDLWELYLPLKSSGIAISPSSKK